MRDEYAFSIFPRTIFIVLLSIWFCSVNGSGSTLKQLGSHLSGNMPSYIPPFLYLAISVSNRDRAARLPSSVWSVMLSLARALAIASLLGTIRAMVYGDWLLYSIACSM